MLKLARSLMLILTGFTLVPSAHAWGCKGHQIIALIAEAHMKPGARAMSAKILAASPIDPALARYCKSAGLDSFADSSTWADDERGIRPGTAPWHFIDIPRGATRSDMAKYCPSATGCVTTALSDQLRILRDPAASDRARGDALRFVIHFVGDIHQPLHASTNNDRGGNCVPAAFFGTNPHETNLQGEDYSPNLHSIWDVDFIDKFSLDRTPQQVADQLDSQFASLLRGLSDVVSNFAAWAWESHQLAESTAYGRLPVKIAIESPRPITGCADDDHISTRMLHLDEHLATDYQNAAAPVVQRQLVKAAIRLAALLNSIWP